MGRGIAAALTLLLLLAHSAVAQTREHVLGGRALAPGAAARTPHGVIVVYSTAAGQYAQDGEGELSPFAQALIESLREPGIKLPKVFRRVSAQVAEASHEAQVPSMLGNWPAEDLPVSQK